MSSHTRNWILLLLLVVTIAALGGCDRVSDREWPTREAGFPVTGGPAKIVDEASPEQPSAAPTATLQPTSEVAVESEATTPPTDVAAEQGESAPSEPEPAASDSEATASTTEALTSGSAMADITSSLQGLPIDDFFEESYKQLLLRSPESLTAYGITKSYGLRNDRLNDLSDAFMCETQALEIAILDLLRAYDRAALTPEQQVSYDIYEWYLDNRVRGHTFMYHNYMVHHFLGSYHDELIRSLTEVHPITDKGDVEDYITRLSGVDEQVVQVIESLKLREEAGIVAPKFIVQMTLPGLRDLAGGSAHLSPFYTAFKEKLNALESLTEAEKQTFQDAAVREISESVQPAFQSLVEQVEHTQTVATHDAGVWSLPDGKAYYAHMLRQETSTDLTPEEIHEMGLAEVDRIQAEMRQVFSDLGYPEDETLGNLMGRAIEEGGYYDVRTQEATDKTIQEVEELLDEADRRADEVFDLRPAAKVKVIADEAFGGGGFYVLPSRDGSRPGAYHSGVGGSWVPKFNLPTIAYHEAVPGHHFQIALAQEMDLPAFRGDLVLNGYAEGWALYAERLAWELGLYDDDPYGNIGRLQLELLRAVRLVADTGVHAQGWTREGAKIYLEEALGDPSGRWSHEIDRYVVLPAQATGYKVGMLKILELRQQAMDALGDQFDIKEFHNVVLGNGSIPLEILEQLVQDYIDTNH